MAGVRVYATNVVPVFEQIHVHMLQKANFSIYLSNILFQNGGKQHILSSKNKVTLNKQITYCFPCALIIQYVKDAGN